MVDIISASTSLSSGCQLRQGSGKVVFMQLEVA
jgi:hypothetical protein